jgi:hypothetical protein
MPSSRGLNESGHEWQRSDTGEAGIWLIGDCAPEGGSSVVLTILNLVLCCKLLRPGLVLG